MLLNAIHQHFIVSVADTTGRIIEVNDAFCRISGYAREELLGQDHRIINSGHHPASFWIEMWRTLTAGQAWRGDICNAARDGSIYWVDSFIAPVRGADGRIERFISLRNDITERKRAERSALQLGRLLQRSFNEIYVFDASSLRFVEVSEGARSNLGYSTGELSQLTPLDLKPAFTRERFERMIAPLLAGEQDLLVFETVHRRKDATTYPVEVRLQLMQADNPVFLAIIQDVTLRHQASEELARRAEELERLRARADDASRAKSEFLANMSHEIRTPLTAILGYAELLRDDGDLSRAPASRLQTIDTIASAGQHLLSVINDILDLSKIEAGRMSVETVETNLCALLAEVEDLLRPRTASKGVALTVALATPLPDRVMSDPTRLRQILMNLAGNAAKFTECGCVRMTARAEGPATAARLVIEVEDTGPGITPANAEQLFAAFSQADATVTRQHGGTGLGLIITRRLARLMGGDVVLAWSEPGQGSRFRVDLPLVPAAGASNVSSLEEAQAEPSPSAASTTATLTGRILLAEDGPVNQRLIAFHLRKAGAEVDVAENGLIALEMFDEADADGAPYDLLLSDMQMPEMDGYTLARSLRERGSSVPIIALTAHAMAEDRRKCLDAGCDDYASKPIDRATLLKTCARWIGKPAGGRLEPAAR